MSFLDRSVEFWVGLIAAVLYVFQRSQSKSILTRAVEAGISGGIGFAVAPAAAAWTGNVEAIAAVVVTALGYLGLDILTSIVADRAAIRQLLIQWLSRGASK